MCCQFILQCGYRSISKSLSFVMCREYSKQLNESRLKVLQARENAVHDLVHDAQQGLSSFSKDQQKYKTLLTDLLVQVRKGLSSLTYGASLHGARLTQIHVSSNVTTTVCNICGYCETTTICLMLPQQHKDCLSMQCIDQASNNS